ncbi:hypothetical protein [Vibrio diabolicus]|uniref:hypothetical protein n=1 Tax=Vibrio diabolicus TaxID=50719 RepID=UPI00211ADAF4|nr:hypothetical protein [Vibrio diabolicus]MCG6221533.1 hypothetical protein [Vibrio diabolicus]
MQKSFRQAEIVAHWINEILHDQSWSSGCTVTRGDGSGADVGIDKDVGGAVG